MHDQPVANSIAHQRQIRTLTTAEMPLLRAHLVRLDSASRHDRFNGYTDEGFIQRYAAKCQTDGTIVVACLEDGVVRGAAELHQPDLSNPLPEIAFSVEASLRRQGVGSILFTRLIAKAKSLGYDSLRITTGAQNEAMRALAQKFGAKLSFRRGESSGNIDLTSHRDAKAARGTTPVDVARAVTELNRAYWRTWLRMAGFGRTA
jgi:RimJ/RimL family protein N-acetyltransferase